VRAYFRRDASAHARADADEVADEHQELLDAIRRRDEALLIETLERHISNYLTPQ
jgi:DNA-binding GntR family transcriptional regulator